MEWLIAPFEVAFVQRALWGGLLVSIICALAGTWVVVRGMAFLGDAMAHGMLPGVAVAALFGANPLIGAAVSCAVMAVGVSALGARRRLSADTGIGLLFVGMLALGVVIVSRSQSFAVDLTGFLFGDVLAVRTADLGFLAAAAVLAAVVAALGHRAFLALAFDPRTAVTLGLRPDLARFALLGLMTLAIVASFHIVGTLLVFGLLIAPPAAALTLASRIPVAIALAALFGALSTFLGLLLSWHAETAAGATIAGVAVGIFFVVAAIDAMRGRRRASRAEPPRTPGAAGDSAGGSSTASPDPLGSPSVAPVHPSVHSETAAAVADSSRASGTPAASAVGGSVGARRRFRRVGTVLLAGVLVASCGAESGDAATEETPHGYVEGAREMADEQIRLVLAAESGRVHVLDPATEETTVLGEVSGVRAMVGDDRYAFLDTDAGVRVIDGGGWTVDHGDHVHYYSAPVREVGTLAVGPVTAVHGDRALTALVLGDRETVLLDRQALDGGTIRERGRVTDGVAVPFGERLLVAVGSTGRLEVRGRDGATETVLDPPCRDPRGRAVTRRGVVFGCADGAVIVTDGDFRARAVPYPRPVPERERAIAFAHRPGSDTLAARAGDSGVWILDVRQGIWTHAPVGPVTAVDTAGAGAPVLALTPDGVLHGLDPRTGVPGPARPLLAEPGADPRIQVDRSRAYLTDERARAVHEIDYADALRVARTLPLDIAPRQLVATGR
ncbi:zinc ABC transporter permease AztB [Nocardia takedensis]|uniref:zinc ABC transporter permease AztB n=1 Tax=Nocardia takedensis TaxID=259390 RepID=UPI0002E14B84|nr:zinc ABC transporter permease AztB [Nocardia takedensis]